MSIAEILKENRSRGWAEVGDGCPEFFKRQIVAIRAAALEGHEYRMSPRLLREVETRSALAQKAVGFVKHLFRSSNGKSLETQLAESLGYDEGLLKMRAYRIGLEVANEQRRLNVQRAEERSRKQRCDALVDRIRDAAEGAL